MDSSVLSVMQQMKVEELHIKQLGDFKAIIAIHNQRLGPALGGCRFIPYDSEGAAIEDALRLARGMSYKAALAGIPQGGGKAVIMRNDEITDRESVLRSFGDFVNSLGGHYITAMDSGTNVYDMDIIEQQTPYVASSGRIGDPSPYTAEGVYQGIQAGLEQLGIGFEGLLVAIQGLGNVGFALAEKLYHSGVRLIVADIDRFKVQKAVTKFAATAVAPEDILRQRCDVFSPCGLGGILTNESVQSLQCQLVAGSANNQLAHKPVGELLYQKGILYAPDYVINAGGLIFASGSYHNQNAQNIDQAIKGLKMTLAELFKRSDQQNQAPYHIADQMAEERLYG